MNNYDEYETTFQKMRFNFYLFFSLLSCEKVGNEIEEYNEPPDLDPSEYKLLEGNINKAYNFDGKTIVNLYDSVVIKDNQFKIYTPTGFGTQLFILNAAKDDIIGVVNITPTTSNLVIDKTSVSIAVLDLLPAFSSLNDEDQKKIIEDVLPNNEKFNALEVIIDSILKSNSSIWDDENEQLIVALAELNDLIAEQYLPGGRISHGGRINGTPDFANWIRNDQGTFS